MYFNFNKILTHVYTYTYTNMNVNRVVKDVIFINVVKNVVWEMVDTTRHVSYGMVMVIVVGGSGRVS